MRRLYKVFVATAIFVSASVSNAAILDISTRQTDGGAVAAGVIANDILVDFDSNIRGQQLVLNLTAGSIFQSGSANTPPDQDFIDLVPARAFDSFVAMGGMTAQEQSAIGSFIVVGGPVNIVPGAPQLVDATNFNMAWAPGTGVNIGSGSDFPTARMSLTNTAMGTFTYFASVAAGTGDSVTKMGTITNGVMAFDDIGGGDPVAVGDPISGSSISLQGAFNDGSGELLSAIVLSNSATGTDPLEITSLVISDDAEGLFSATVNGTNPLAIDLGIDVAAGKNGPIRNVSALLTVNTNGGVLTYNLGARVPEPSTVALSALALVGLVGFARRKK